MFAGLRCLAGRFQMSIIGGRVDDGVDAVIFLQFFIAISISATVLFGEGFAFCFGPGEARYHFNAIGRYDAIG